MDKRVSELSSSQQIHLLCLAGVTTGSPWWKNKALGFESTTS